MKLVLFLFVVTIPFLATGQINDTSIIKVSSIKRAAVWKTEDINSSIGFYLQENDTAYVISYRPKKKKEAYNYFYVVFNRQKGYLIEDENIRIDMSALRFLQTNQINTNLRENLADIADQKYWAHKTEIQKSERRRIDSVRKREAHVRDSILARQRELNDSLELVKLKRDVDSIQKEIDDALSGVIKKFGPYGLGITSWDWEYENEYSYAPDMTIRVFNPGTKRIRYVHFTISAWDQVDGRLTSMGRSSVTLKGIGPVESKDFASWTFDHFFYSKVIHRLKIETVRLEYFDGSSKTISNIGKIML